MANINNPNCRYGHGDLLNVTCKNDHPKWAYVSQSNLNVAFSGKLYVCKTCGYTELFDDEILATLANEGAQ